MADLVIPEPTVQSGWEKILYMRQGIFSLALILFKENILISRKIYMKVGLIGEKF
ncbi:unnamed protein product [marine sediment metagenome]|uniref:Uncharacterized protein n=1 Tax=marine sediment metagenome TaxID=412755 RepID=X1DIK6_9ZZZZ